MKWLLVNFDGREYETDHCTNAFIYRRSYWATISQNFTYVPKVLNFFLLYIWGCPRWASYQLTKDLNEKNNCLRNKYWLNGFSHKRRIVIKAPLHESNDPKLWFMEFITTPASSPQLSLLILSSRVLLVARVFSLCWHEILNIVVYRDELYLFSCCWAKRNKFISLWCVYFEIINLSNATQLILFFLGS